MPACLCSLYFSQPFAFPLRLTSGSPSLCPRSPIASGHPPCALWCRVSTPVPDRLLWLLTVSVGLADMHCLPPAPALPPEYHGWPGERCDAMLSWHPDISSGPVNRRKRQTRRGVPGPFTRFPWVRHHLLCLDCLADCLFLPDADTSPSCLPWSLNSPLTAQHLLYLCHLYSKHP